MHILVLEDNLADARLMEEAIRDQDGVHQVSTVTDGGAAMVFVRREGPYVAMPRPSVILLDRNLPRKEGQEVLREVKADPALRHIPVIIMTSTQADKEVQRMDDLGRHIV